MAWADTIRRCESGELTYANAPRTPVAKLEFKSGMSRKTFDRMARDLFAAGWSVDDIAEGFGQATKVVRRAIETRPVSTKARGGE